MSTLPFRPYPLLRSGHLQTMMVGLLCGTRPKYQARNFTVPLEDGESLVVHEETGASVDNNAPLVILIHGLGGDHRSPYLARLAPDLNQAGMRVWRVDLRGCGDGLSLAWRPPNAGRSEDLAAVVRAAIEGYPESPIHLVGFSLSGNIVLKMLGESAAGALQTQLDLSRIKSALAIAPPVNLHDCADNMDRFSRRIYTHYYLRVLHEQVQVRRNLWPQWQQRPENPAIRSIRQFDARYTAPLSGFVDADEYYTKSSAIGWLKHVTTPTKILVDRHDPIVTVKSIESAELNTQSTQLIYTCRGGHMGYFGRDPQGKLFRWMEAFVVDTLKQQLVISG